MEILATSEKNPSLFDDGKDEGALRTIGEVARALGIKHHVLRYWEEQFPMLTPLTRAGGRRYYRSDDIALIQQIDRLLHREGYTIRGARLALSGKGEAASKNRPDTGPNMHAKPAISAAQPPIAPAPEANEIIAALRVLRGHLEGIHERLSEALTE